MLFQKKVKKETYDAANKKNAIRASICTGEQVAGFKDLHSGAFEEIISFMNRNFVPEGGG